MQNCSDYNAPMLTGYKLWFISYVYKQGFICYDISVHFKVYVNMFNEYIYRLAVPLKIWRNSTLIKPVVVKVLREVQYITLDEKLF